MPRMNPSPFGHGGPRQGGDVTEAPTDDIPRSHPEDRQEGNFNPDPILECWNCEPADAGAPSGQGDSGAT